MSRRILTAVIALTMYAAMSTALAAQQWGTLKARFVYDGTPPTPKPINVTKDVEFCGKHGLVDTSWVVDPKTKGVKNVLVYLRTRGGPPSVHPDYAKTANEAVHLDNINCAFEPKITIVRTSQSLVIGNKDPVGHNTKADLLRNTSFNQMIPQSQSFTRKFTQAEGRPMPVSCSIHPWMSGSLLVLDHPYSGVTDKTGLIEIKNLPVGDWEFQLMHDGRYLRDVTIAGVSTGRRGRLKYSIKSGTNDLGVVAIKAE